MFEPDLDPSSLRDWMAAVGLLRVVSETTAEGSLVWRLDRGRYRLSAMAVPSDLADLCAGWVERNSDKWHFAGRANVDFDATFWREHSMAASGLETSMWCAVASDAVWHRDGKKLKASGLEYAHGGGHQHWLASLAGFLSEPVTAVDFARVLSGQRDATTAGGICRWDPACERDHALRAKAPTSDKMWQDQTVNALAAIGLASCPSAPGEHGLRTPLVSGRDRLDWPIWTDPLRIADLEASLCCGWIWPSMTARRWLSGKLYCFARGELREPGAFGKPA